MRSQIVEFIDFTKSQKSRYLEDEILFFLQIKKFFNYSSKVTLWQKTLLCRGGNLSLVPIIRDKPYQNSFALFGKLFPKYCRLFFSFSKVQLNHCIVIATLKMLKL